MAHVDELEGLAEGVYLRAAQAAARPERRRRLSEWAEEEMRLSSESSALPGRFRPYPYQVAVMDAITDPRVERVTFIKSARVGGTAAFKAALAYHMSEVPAPMLYALPTIADAERFSTTEIAPMLRDTPVLRGRVADPRARDSGNTILKKNFVGGSLTLVGANSARGFRGSTIRVLFLDELDGYPPTAGSEGDQEKLAEKRTETFHNRKILKCSTPTNKGLSRIEANWEKSDQRRYFVPCPECGGMQFLKWSGFQWEKDDAGSHRPETVHYACEHCGVLIPPKRKRWMVQHGEWVITNPGDGRHAGFHIWTAYSLAPNTEWPQLVAEFLDAKAGGPETLKTFVNTVLGETWDLEQGEGVEPESLFARREGYDAAQDGLPEGVLVITAAVDVQDNRLEVEAKGWGVGEESWSLEHWVLMGDPGHQAVWEQLAGVLDTTWERPDGVALGISTAFIDSGGHHSQAVYDFARPRAARRVWACKGASQPGKPIVGRPTKTNRGRVNLVPVGTEAAKDLIYSRYRLDAPGPGYMHFPAHYDEEWFHQLTAERAVVKYKKGVPHREWKVVPAGRRNEATDLQVYNLAAFRNLNVNMKRLAASIERRAEAIRSDHTAAVEREIEQPTRPTKKKRAPRKQKATRRPRKKGGWANRY